MTNGEQPGFAARAIRRLKRLPVLDRRTRFRDLARLSPEQRSPRSPVIQFYSPDNNIGNFTPVLGIRAMIGRDTDTWSMHDRNADFGFINEHYRCAIIGGAGLLHGVFEPFWRAMAERCRIPMIIWGVGVCIPDGQNPIVPRETVARVAGRCELINVRDDLTADTYALRTADISACPTLVYCDTFRSRVVRDARTLLYSSHIDLVAPEETQRLVDTARGSRRTFLFTDNIQRRRFGLRDIILKRYCPAGLVVTTRLHGSIIAHGLGIPYIAVARDEKIRRFNALYGNGVCVESADELKAALAGAPPAITNTQALHAVRAFGRRASAWVESQVGGTSDRPVEASQNAA